MKSKKKLWVAPVACLLIFLAMVNQGCNKLEGPGSVAINQADAARQGLRNSVVNLVSDTAEYSPLHLDSNLVNAWGIAFGPTGGIWVSAADKGVSTIYDKNGNTLRAPVAIPFGSDPNGGEPTGQVFNSTTSFVIPSTSQTSRFIFATENGTIAAWASGNSAVTVADRSAQEAVYKGIEMINNAGTMLLAATDFHNGHVDVFDANFNFVSSSMFTDPNIPAGYAPFNIRKLGSNIFVTYAKQLGPDNEDDEAGPGNGYVSIFNADGSFNRRFTSQGALNSPWGIEMLKLNHGFNDDGDSQDENEDVDTDDDDSTAVPIVLIGNFGDGHINQYRMDGTLVGPLMSNGAAIEIEGLWAISYAPQGNTAYRDVRNRIYFTAGPDDEEHGVFGYIGR